MTVRKVLLFFVVVFAVGIGVTASFDGAARRSLKTPEEAYPIRFVAFGDMGTGDKDQFDVARQMAVYHDEYPYDTVLMLGDNIYPTGNPKDLPAKFEQPYAELLMRGVNFYASLGNHDVFKGRDAQMNYPPFHMGGRAYYSFIKGVSDSVPGGLVQFFALDTTNFDIAQQQWLERALAESKAPWKFVYMHHPLYSSGKTHGSDNRLRTKIEPLVVKYGVTAVFSGHDHIYERTKPQQGVQYFVCGIGGKLRTGNLDRRSPFLEVGNDQEIGFMFVEVTAAELRFQAISGAGRVFDSGTIAPRSVGRGASAAK
jgi:3',5'-cyclic AMP phosphodiesterase CpdA